MLYRAFPHAIQSPNASTPLTHSSLCQNIDSRSSPTHAGLQPIRRSPLHRLVIHATRILTAPILIDRASLIVLRQQLLNLPVPLLGADTELQILPCDRVPVLVHHHHRQQVADRGEEQPVEIVLRGFADRAAEEVEDHLPDDEEEDAEGDVPQRPAVLQRVRDEDDLHDGVDEQADAVEEVEHHEEPHGVGGPQPGEVLEGEEGDGEGDDEGAGGAAAQEPDGLPRAVLVELEADEAVDQQAGAERGGEAVLHGGEVGVGGGAGGDDAGVEDEGGYG